jgi:hypothetical protein
MFNWIQHLFTVRALQRENSDLMLKVTQLQSQIDELKNAVKIKDEELLSIKSKLKPPMKLLIESPFQIEEDFDSND